MDPLGKTSADDDDDDEDEGETEGKDDRSISRKLCENSEGAVPAAKNDGAENCAGAPRPNVPAPTADACDEKAEVDMRSVLSASAMEPADALLYAPPSH
jgi:hypothetical protein